MFNKANKPVYIYSLEDPGTGQVRYIGKTEKPRARYQAHLNGSAQKNTHVYNWIRKLIREGKTPVMRIVEIATEDTWQDRERYWINEFRMRDEKMTNITDGGEGASGLNHSEEAKQRISQARKGMKFTPEHVQNMSLSRKGKAAWNKGLRLTEAQKSAATEARRKLTDEEVGRILQLIDEGVISQRKIAKQFSVSPALVTMLKQGAGCYKNRRNGHDR